MELADGLAADVGYRHTVGGYRSGVDVTVATASIYSMVLGGREFTDCDDILLRAFITRVGTSSMEVCVEIEQVCTHTCSLPCCPSFVATLLDSHALSPLRHRTLSWLDTEVRLFRFLINRDSDSILLSLRGS